ncbi:MAG: hypothetical protein AB7M12_10930 [Hyphomonadaceae bacterium]
MNNSDRRALQEMLKRRADQNTETPEAARDWLIKEGLYDDDGKLLPQYGGEQRSDDRD